MKSCRRYVASILAVGFVLTFSLAAASWPTRETEAEGCPPIREDEIKRMPVLEECSISGGCTDGRICCKTSSGHKCVYPVDVRAARCPMRLTNRTWWETINDIYRLVREGEMLVNTCELDEQCPTFYVCCFNGVGKACLKLDTELGVFCQDDQKPTNRCYHDLQCNADQHCYHGYCCKTVYKPTTKTECPPLPANVTENMPRIEQCKPEKNNCKDGRLCCALETGHKCLYAEDVRQPLCPHQDKLYFARKSCKTDYDCDGADICCSYKNRRICLNPGSFLDNHCPFGYKPSKKCYHHSECRKFSPNWHCKGGYCCKKAQVARKT